MDEKHMIEMEASEVADNLADLIRDNRDDFPERIAAVNDYRAVGMLTSDAGFVMTLGDGSEFQVTVVKSRAAR
ncbi:MAG: hypothetical protein ACRD88_06420 [Terriglobia bacterium]